jgi:UDP-N-acetylmuramyl pentapeptide phosphotransferase/UDP-N-acetylglucosamine-1-phosphate transferase
MDGINGITAGYSLAVLIPLLILNRGLDFIEESLLVVAILGVLVFCIFNFRPKGKAKCFAGDVGSIGTAYIMLFAISKLIFQTGDVTYLLLLLVYGVDGGLTIVHRVMLHENLGQAHRKHAYQIMANELKIGHIKVSLLYMVMQFVVSLGLIYLCPNTMSAHLLYGICLILLFACAYIVFMKKYYYLHEEYLHSLKDERTTD